MKTKRIIAGIMACAVIGGNIPYYSSFVNETALLTNAADDPDNNPEWNLSTEGSIGKVSGYDGTDTNIVLPTDFMYTTNDVDEYYLVTKIAYRALKDEMSIESITIPDGYTYIANNAFENCTSLKSITIPDSVEYIGAYAFSGCVSLESIKLPSSLKELSAGLFKGCTSLKKIEISENVTKLSNVFADCENLEELFIYNPDISFNTSGAKDPLNLSHKITVYGYSGSTAEKYAANYGHNFIALDGETTTETTTTTTTTSTSTSTTTTVTTVSEIETTTTITEDVTTETENTTNTTENITTETTTTETTTLEPTLKGDANEDGEIAIADAVAVAAFVANSDKNPLSEQGQANADVHNTGNGLNASDAFAIQQFATGIIKEL